MKVLVLGGGFVGGPVAAYLARQGHSVACATRSGMLSLPAMLAGVQPFGLEQPDALLAILDRVEPEAVIHLAGPAGDVACRAHPRHAVEAHVTLAALLADIVQRWKPHLRVVYGSSHLVFEGAALGRTSESDAPTPLTLYASLKVAGEALLAQTPRGSCIVRMPNIYGDDFSASRLGVVERMLRACLAHEALDVNMNGSIDLLHVEDFARLLLRVLTQPCEGLVHASGEFLTLRNLAFKMRVASGAALGVLPDLIERDGPARAPVRCRRVADWAPRHNISTTLLRVLTAQKEAVHARV